MACLAGASVPAMMMMLVAVAGGGHPELSSSDGDLVAHCVTRRYVAERGGWELRRVPVVSCPEKAEPTSPPLRVLGKR